MPLAWNLPVGSPVASRVPGKFEGALTRVDSFIEGMPKAELHLHLEGTLEPELKFRLAARNAVDLPYRSVADMRAAYDFDDLSSFLDVYYEGMTVLRTERDYHDLAWSYFAKAAAQKVVYAEVFFDPQAHIARGIDFDTVVDGIVAAQRDAADEFGLESNLIMCFLRDMSAASAMQTLELSLGRREEIIGVGLDSDESGNPPIRFEGVFTRARAEGYHITAHCDVDQTDSRLHLWQCLNDIEVERIDHGVNALEDDELIAEIVRRRLGLTVCPISNRHVAGGLKAAEVKALLARGVLVTINSDDPAYFPGYINENMTAVQQAAGLSAGEVEQLVRNAFEVSWLSRHRKDEYLARVTAYVSSGNCR